ncbi:MAG: GNAT family N-acetyltransferase [Anaerolineales bacterium]|nr:GNAT family N-acetyltransferase [Anaerolineales bacterium]
MENISVSPALPAESTAIQTLLQAAGLPHQDFADHLEHFLTARVGEKVIGAVGLEVYRSTGLLRSLVVHPDYRGQNLGRLLTAQILETARTLGLKELFLLTTTAAGFFPKFGFGLCERGSAPDEIRATKEFTSICPATAVCMVRKL